MENNIKNQQGSSTLPKFYKMQGCGNDFIVAQIDIFGMNVEAYPSLTTFTLKEKELISRKCVQVCDRHFGIGADGVLLITVNDKSVWKMTAINSDGTWALMCGNGLRCVAALLSSKYGQGSKFEIETDSGSKMVEVIDNNIQNSIVKIAVGTPKNLIKQTIENCSILECLAKAVIYTVLLGNLHVVVLLDEKDFDTLIETNNLESVAKMLQKAYNGNANFCALESENRIRVTTYELGAGLTLACGTGSCSSAAVCHSENLVTNNVQVITNGGLLTIDIQDTGHSQEILMTGPASLVYTGVLTSSE